MEKKSMIKSVGGYFSGVYREGKKVRWTSADDVVKNTGIVLGYLVSTAVFFYVVNFFIVKMFGMLGINM